MPKQNTKNNRMSSRGNIQAENESEGMDNELHQLFLDELADVYNAEQQLTKLPLARDQWGQHSVTTGAAEPYQQRYRSNGGHGKRPTNSADHIPLWRTRWQAGGGG